MFWYSGPATVDHFLIRLSYEITVKFRKLAPGLSLYFSKALFEGLIFGGTYIRRDLSTEGNLCFEIDWASLIVGSKFTVLLCFTLYLRAIFQVQAPRGAYIWRGHLTEGFLYYLFGGAYIWRGLYMEHAWSQSEPANRCSEKDHGEEVASLKAAGKAL